ncbi:hypothetical protein U1Q18_023015, partial [Sarracenia purpurea var. burkii]
MCQASLACGYAVHFASHGVPSLLIVLVAASLSHLSSSLSGGAFRLFELYGKAAVGSPSDYVQFCVFGYLGYLPITSVCLLQLDSVGCS